MGKSVWKDLFREIKRTFGRFIAIFAIVAIGVAFFAGVTASSNDMKNSTDHYYDDYNMSDLRLLSSIGFNEDDINVIREVQGVKGICPAYSQDAVIRKDSIETAVHIMSVPVNTDRDNKDYINQLRIKEGRLPEKSGECVVRYEDTKDNFSIGDTIKLSSGTQDDINDSLKDSEYTVVGTVYTPYYVSYDLGTTNVGSGRINYLMYITEDEFMSDYYNEIFATVDGANAWQRFRFITLPLLQPALASSIIYNLIGGLKLYDVIIALTDGGPAKKTHSLATYIANRYFDAERAGYAAAIGVFSFVMIMVISMIVNGYFRKKEVDY